MARLDLIKQLLKKKGITIQNLADCVKISNQGMQRIINEGSTTIERLEKISKCLEVPVSFFFPDDPNALLYFTEDDFTFAKHKIKEAGHDKYEKTILNELTYFSRIGGLTKEKMINYIISHYDDMDIHLRDIEELKKSVNLLQKVIEQNEKIIDLLYNKQRNKENE